MLHLVHFGLGVARWAMQNQSSLELLEHYSFPDMAAAIRCRMDKIVHRWETSVRQAMPAAEELPLHQLRNDMPVLLRQMADALEAEEPAATQQLMTVAQPHGAMRFHQRYTVNELLTEYHLLRQILLEEISEQMGRAMSIPERVALNLGVDAALRHAVVEFVNHQTAKLQSSLDAQAKYLSFFSHDVRSNLNGIVLMVEVLRRQVEGKSEFAGLLEDLGMMRQAIVETVEKMDRFLQADRLRRGMVEPKIAPFDLHELVEELTSQAASHARERGVELAAQTPPSAILCSDQELIGLILQNMIDLILKHSRRGRIQLVAMPWTDPGGTGWTVALMAPEAAIPPEELGRVLDASIDAGASGQAGNGVRVSIMRQAAQLLGARLSAECRPGKGTVFEVVVPNRAMAGATEGENAAAPSERRG